MKNFIILILIIIATGCGTLKAPYYATEAQSWEDDIPHSGKKVVHSLYLLGDAGELDDKVNHTNYVMDAMAKSMANDEVETSLVVLGDNIYPAGLPKKDDPFRPMAEEILNAHIRLADAHSGKTYVIPGNHDWNKWKKDGRKAVLRQEDYFKDHTKTDRKHIKFYPKNACGDPEFVKINKDLIFVFIDTQWWLHDWKDEKKMNKGCDIKSRGDLLKRIEEILIEHKNDEIVMLMHHPIKSDGTHGGRFSIKDHLFPLQKLKHNLWIPLPILGSIYPIYRQVTGSKQDIPNKHNKAIMRNIDNMAKRLRVNVIFAAGHEHGLQYFDGDKLKYIVSGGGSRQDFIRRGGKAQYARDTRGYVKINFHEDFESWAEFYSISGADQPPVLEYRVQLRPPRAGTIEEEIKYPPIHEDTKLIAANEKFAAGPLKKMVLGGQYRDMWATPVNAEVIDLETKKGGLTPIKKGGGMASNSLRMRSEDGKQYILRSIKKDYTKLVPPGFSNLKLIDVLADQNSASHPYNALIIPTLSKAAGVYYTDPQLTYLQHQKGLGNYNSQFPEELYLLEERPTGDWSDASQFGNSSEIIGYVDLLETLREKKNHHIDQQWVLKSRIFDLFIHDWDRHDDQWRWAKFKEGDTNVYRPIPRDRDQAFYRFKGIVPWYISTFIMQKFKTMKDDVIDVKSLSFNARHFDRFFLNDLEWTEWVKIISQMQKDITDEVIQQAVEQSPEEVMHLEDDEKLAKKLKARRNNLMSIGKRLYTYLSKEVDITGSDNDDLFYINRMSDGSVLVKVSVESSKRGTIEKYSRKFYPLETQEIRIYGERGKDEFVIEGSDNELIKIRIIGGEGKDVILNSSSANNLLAYDDPKGLNVKGPIKDRRSNDLEANMYDRHEYEYNNSLPSLTFGKTVDDGFWFGAAVNWTTHGWRKDPYQSKQRLSLSLAPQGNGEAVQIDYEGHFPNAFGKLDFDLNASLSSPQYENYFGIGNESTNPLRETEYHWVRMKEVLIAPLLRKDLNEAGHLEFGPLYQYRDIQNTDDRVVQDEILGLDDDAFDGRHYFGGIAHYHMINVDSRIAPANGIKLDLSLTHRIEPQKAEKVTELYTAAQFYLTLINRPQLVFANNIGFHKSYGDLQIYQNPQLGNNHGLRGFRNERFRGESAFFHNMDLRMRMANWNNDILPMDIGLLTGYDYGKVYVDSEDSDIWHSSFTLGMWFDLLGTMILQPYYSFNNEQNTFSLRIGFNF